MKFTKGCLEKFKIQNLKFKIEIEQKIKI